MEILSPLFDRDPEEWRPWLLFFSGLFCLAAFGTVLWWLLSYDRESGPTGAGVDVKKWGYPEKSGNGSESHTESEQDGDWGFSKKPPAGVEETSTTDDGVQSWPRIPTEAEIGARAEMLAQWRAQRGIAASQEDDWMLAERELYMKECDLSPLPDREEFYRSGMSSADFNGVSETAVNELSRLDLTDAESVAALSDSDKKQIRKWFSARDIDLDFDSLASPGKTTGRARVSVDDLEEIVTSEFAGESVEIREPFGIVYTSEPAIKDDLQKIHGVGPVLEKKLHDFGVYRFKQIANWPEEAIDEFQEQLSFPDRISRDDWVGQCENFIQDLNSAAS